jgi:hypothetical protein
MERGVPQFVFVDVAYSTASTESIGPARLTTPGAPLCAAGIFARETTISRDAWAETRARASGDASFSFRRDEMDREGLSLAGPLVVDLPVLSPAPAQAPTPAPADRCLRLPLVDGSGAPEWREPDDASIGVGVRVRALGQTVYGMAADVALVLRAGPWVGPVHIRGELGVGGGAAPAEGAPPQDNGWFLTVTPGVSAEWLFAVAGRVGLAAGAGYDATWIDFVGAPASNLPGGARGWLHGPRAGLSLLLLPGPSHSPAFRGRTDTWSSSFELYGTAALNDDRGTVPVFWFAYAGDLAF